MTRSDLRLLARATVPGAKVSVITNAQLNLILELGILDIAAYAVCLRKNDTFNVTAETGEYAISTQITDFLTIDKSGLWWNDGTEWRKLDSVTLQFMDETFPAWRDDSSDDPLRYSLEGDILTVHPKPDTTLADGFKLYYGQKSTKMSLDTHYPFVGTTTERPHLSIFDDSILKYVKWKLEQMVNKDSNVNFNEQTYIKERDEKKKLFNRRLDVSASSIRAGFKRTKFQGPKVGRG